jgi:hypothetical protein
MEPDKVLRDNSMKGWGFFIVLAFLGGVLWFFRPEQWIVAIVLAVVGLLFVILSPTLTVRVSPSKGILSLQSTSIFKRTHKEYPIANIRAIEIESTRAIREITTDHRSTFRLVMRMNDQTTVPFHTTYTSNYRTLEKQAIQIRKWLGLSQTEEKPRGYASNLTTDVLKAAQQMVTSQQETLTGSQAQVYVSDDVHWKLETRSIGTLPISCWSSPDFTLADHFYYITQKMEGQRDLGGILGGLNSTLFVQAMNIFGITEEQAPGRNTGQLISNLDPRLSNDYSVFSDSVLLLNKVLNPWVVNALAVWADKNPLPKGSQNQTIILIGPKGVNLYGFGYSDQEKLDKLTDLGVEMVKSLKSFG